MKNIFQSISFSKPKKSSFDLTHMRKFSFEPGRLYPILCQEVLPGDKWNYDVSALVRMQAMISPIMHMVDVCSYQFFVPDRLTMERSKFEVFITGGKDGNGEDAQGNTVQIPHCFFWASGSSTTAQNIQWLNTGTLADYLGIGLGSDLGAGVMGINMMPFIGFWLIWNEYFRDQNVHPDYVGLYPGIFQATGNITAAIHAARTSATNPFPFFEVPRVCWEKDYFRSALPFAQRGAPVETPLTGTATVTYKDVSTVRRSDGGLPFDTDPLFAETTQGDLMTQSSVGPTTGRVENIDDVTLTSGGFTINALRLAARLQEWLERMARGGARYIEQIKSQFGVTSSDARLQRPEYLSGGKMPVHISEVLQTTPTNETPIGDMAGHGVAAGKLTGFNRFFEEHGKLYSFIFLRPKATYQNGIPRMFTQRFDKLNWAWPPFAHLGEQEILRGEIFANLEPGENDATWGYQQRYAEYKYIPSTVHGEFRDLLDHWHWGEIFENAPTLNGVFMSCDPPSRIFNVEQTGDPLYCIVTNRITAIRPLPYYGEPSL